MPYACAICAALQALCMCDLCCSVYMQNDQERQGTAPTDSKLLESELKALEDRWTENLAKTFVETRSWWAVLKVFWRVWALNLLCLQALTIVVSASTMLLRQSLAIFAVHANQHWVLRAASCCVMMAMPVSQPPQVLPAQHSQLPCSRKAARWWERANGLPFTYSTPHAFLPVCAICLRSLCCCDMLNALCVTNLRRWPATSCRPSTQKIPRPSCGSCSAASSQRTPSWSP